MSPRREPTNFRIDPELMEALREVRDEEGLPIAEQVRQAIRFWLDNRVPARVQRPARKPPRRRA